MLARPSSSFNGSMWFCRDLMLFFFARVFWLPLTTQTCNHALHRFDFYRAACNATNGIAVGILSVRTSVSVCLSVRCVYCDKTKWCTADILIRHETAITLVLWHQQWLVGDAPFFWNLCRKWPIPFEKRRLQLISAYNVSTIRDSEKKFNCDEYRVDYGLCNEL